MFRQIHTSIWAEDWFLPLPAVAKLLFIYLVTSKYTQPSGFAPLTPQGIAEEIGLTENEVSLAFTSLGDKVILFPGWGLWIRRFSAWQGKGGKWQIAIKANLSRLPLQIQQAFLKEYPDTPSDGVSDGVSDGQSRSNTEHEPQPTVNSNKTTVISKQRTVSSNTPPPPLPQAATSFEGLLNKNGLVPELQGLYPLLNLQDELKKCSLWWSASKHKVKSPELAYRNWLAKAESIRKENPGPKSKSGYTGM